MLFVNQEVESLLVQTVCNSSPMESGISCGSEWLGLGGSVVKIYLPMQETQEMRVQSLG